MIWIHRRCAALLMWWWRHTCPCTLVIESLVLLLVTTVPSIALTICCWRGVTKLWLVTWRISAAWQPSHAAWARASQTRIYKASLSHFIAIFHISSIHLNLDNSFSFCRYFPNDEDMFLYIFVLTDLDLFSYDLSKVHLKLQTCESCDHFKCSLCLRKHPTKVSSYEVVKMILFDFYSTNGK